jgi:site-specific recombinase XerD
MLQRGVDIRTVQELMGHMNIQTTMRYLAVSDERLVAAVALLG